MNRKKINIIKLFFFGIIAVSLLGACKDKQPYADFKFIDVTDPKIEFVNISKNAKSFEWNFGDGKTSTAFSPTHTYTSNGTYTVSLIRGSLCCEGCIAGEDDILPPGQGPPQ